MKNLKKVLALVLAFACAFTMFAGALTFSDVKPGDDYSAAITMLSDLEVISGDGKGNYNPTGTITRAEACVLIANMMNGGKADTARFAGGSNFSDVPKTYWGESAIAYCVQNGVAYGVGGGKFAPTRAITDAEFVAMVTRAMGYDTAANPLSFPYGNYTAAVNNGIVDNVPYVEGSPCTRGEAAQIIYDCLFADYARYTANQNVIHNADDDHDTANKLISVVFGLERASNIDGEKENSNKKCTQHYFVITGYDCDEKTTTINTIELSDSKYASVGTRQFEADFDITPFVGHLVVLWGEDSHGSTEDEVDVIKAIETVDGQKSYDYNPTMDWEDDLDLDEVDGAFVDGVKKSNVENIIEAKNGYSYKLVDWDDDKEIDYVVTYAVDYYEVTAVTSKQVKLSGGLELDLDGKTDVAFECQNGVKTHTVLCEIPDDIEKGDIVSIDKSDLCEYENEVVWVMDIVEAETKEVTEVTAKGHKVYFDDEYLECADVTIDDADGIYADIDDDDDDYTWDVWQDANGYIIKLAPASDSYSGYLLVLGQGNGNVNTNNRKLATLDVYYDDNTSAEDVEVAKDAVIEKADGTELYVEDSRSFNFALVGHAFKYRMEDEKIVKLIEVPVSYDFEYRYDAEEEKYYDDNDGIDGYWMDDLEVVFVVKFDEGNLGQYNDWADQTAQIKTKNVKAVSYDKLPDIGDHEDTKDRGAATVTSTDTQHSLADVAVLGVNTFKYFDDIDRTVALVTDITYKTSTETYTVKAVVPGEGLTTFTAKEGDLDDYDVQELEDARDDLDELKMIYGEIETVDGKLIAFANMTDDTQGNFYDEYAAVGSEVAYRGGINHYSSTGKVVSMSSLIATGEDTVEYDDSTVTVAGGFKITDDTEFFVIDDDGDSVPAMPEVGEKLSTFDGFTVDSVKEISFSTALNSYMDDDNSEGEMQVADVIVNEEREIIMMFFFEELIETEDYEAPVTGAMTALSDQPNGIAVMLFNVTDDKMEGEKTYKKITGTDLGKILDDDFTVTVAKKDPYKSIVGNPIVYGDPVEAEIADVTFGDSTETFAIIALKNVTLENTDKVTVTVKGFGSVTFTFPGTDTNLPSDAAEA